MPQPLIEFQDFSFQYFAQAEPTLRNISLKIYPGEKLLIVGPSGCGKSTLAHCINGLIPFSIRGKSSGSLKLKGQELASLNLFEISKTVGTVLQDSDSQFIGMTVAEDLAFAAENDVLPREELHRLVREAAEAVAISGHLKHAPTELSGGQKQRVAIGGILSDRVEMLLFDEPLANLDPASGKTAIELIDALQQKTGAAVLIIEHRLEDVLHRDVDRIVLMDEGRIIFDGLPDDLLSTGLLRQHGIREPLYLTALRYAGLDIYPEMQPHSIRSLRLKAEEKQKLQAWFEQTPPREVVSGRPLLFEAEDIHFRYENGFAALRGVSLKLHQGELMAIVGKNGAGKSTFSKVICGFEKQQQGKLLFDDEDLMQLSVKERADHIAYVMQNPNLMLSQTLIADEVALGLRARAVPEDEIRRRSEEALRVCGLWPFRNWPVSALSYGQKKRLTVAAILSLNPQMIILDEPTAGQDYRHYTEIMEFLLSLSQRGLTIVLITHDMHLMQEYAERAVVFTDGRILADDLPSAVLTRPELIAEACLKETSLFALAKLCDIAAPEQFVQRFMDFERRLREQQSGKGVNSGQPL